MSEKSYILTLSCDDKVGIVSAVSSFLADNGGFILESAQYGDPSTNKFFMRTAFKTESSDLEERSFSDKFSQVADKFSMDWEIKDITYRPRVLIMVSKASHCLNSILHRKSTGNLAIEIPAIVSNHDSLKEMAQWYDIDFHHLPVTSETKEEQESKVLQIVEKENIDVVVLARYMQILSPKLCKELHGKAINIHHSFLPSFKGANPYKQAYDRGVKIIGATAHYVTEDLDEGPIIEQEVVNVDHKDSPEDLKSLGQDIESRVLARALKYHIENRVVLNGNKTVVFR